MAMGDNNAVELGQGAHVLLGMQSGLIAAEELLTIHSRAPRGRLACGIVIDDILFAEKVPRRGPLTLVNLQKESDGCWACVKNMPRGAWQLIRKRPSLVVTMLRFGERR